MLALLAAQGAELHRPRTTDQILATLVAQIPAFVRAVRAEQGC